jgi:hypothetical protein
MRLLENMRTLIDDVPVSMKDRFSPFLSLIDTVHTLLSLEQDAQTLDSLEGVISSHVEELEEEFLRARGEL